MTAAMQCQIDGSMTLEVSDFFHASGDFPEAWVYRPKDVADGNLANNSPPAGITMEDRRRSIRAGMLWKYVQDVGGYHCSGEV